MSKKKCKLRKLKIGDSFTYNNLDCMVLRYCNTILSNVAVFINKGGYKHYILIKVDGEAQVLVNKYYHSTQINIKKK